MFSKDFLYTGLFSRKLCIFLLMFSTELLHSVSYFFFLYGSRSSSLCTVFDSISSNIDEVLSINPSANDFVFGDFNVISNDLIQKVNFPTRIPDCDSHSPTLLDLFLSSDDSICFTMAFPQLGNSDHVVVSVSIGFPSNSQRDVPFHRIAYDHSRAEWDGLRHHLRDVPWDDIFKLGASVNFARGFRLELMYISLIETIRSSLTHLHGFQLLALLP